MQTLYDVLKVQEDAPLEVIRAAYKVLSSKYQPGKNPGDSPASEMMQKINRAYSILRDPESRSRYDAALKRMRDQHHAETSTPQVDKREAKAPTSDSFAHRPHSSPHQSSRATVAQIWEGRMGLCKTYWIYFILVTFIWGIALGLVKPGSPIAIVLGLALLVYLVIIHVGIWRAADRYTGYAIWAILAKFAVAGPIAALVVGTAAAIILPAYQDYKTKAAVANSPAPNSLATFDPSTARPVDPQPLADVATFDPLTARSLEAQPTSQLTAEEAHFQTILNMHPDASQISKSQHFQNWLNVNPSFQKIASEGTADEVIRMLSIYKASPTLIPPEQAQSQKIELPSREAEKSMRNLNDWSNRHWNELQSKGG